MQGALGTCELDENIVGRGGHCLDDDDKYRAELVPQLPPGPGAPGHQDAQRQAQSQGNGQGGQADEQGNRDFLGDDGGDSDVFPVFNGVAQVALKQLAEEAHQLDGEGVIEAQLVEANLDLSIRQLIKILKVSLNGHQP